MPFFGVLKKEIYGTKPIEKMSDEEIGFLVNLTKDVVGIIEKEVNVVDFWENYTKQKRLESYLVSHILKAASPSSETPEKEWVAKESSIQYNAEMKHLLFDKRKEIANNLKELAAHVFGKGKVL